VPGYFLDTNIVYYAFTNDQRALASQRLLAGTFVISAQVLNEFASSTRRKAGKDWSEIAVKSADLIRTAHRIVPLTETLHSSALEIVQRYKTSFYDALIIAAALEAECDTLYSEDMQDGLVIDDRLTVRNPFGSAA
jgi:predicted nucleic acid-binding protein